MTTRRWTKRRRYGPQLAWLLLAASFGCAHQGIDAWAALTPGQTLVGCTSQAPCTLRLVDAGAYVRRGTGQVAILHLPAGAALQVHHDAQGPSAAGWVHATQAHAAFNAGFYAQNDAHVGLLRAAGAWLQPRGRDDWHGLMLSGPREANLAATQLLDQQDGRSRDRYAALAEAYDHVVQAMVLLDGNATFRCRHSSNAASRTALVTDGDGALYVVVTQGAYTLANFAELLRAQFPNLTLALNFDGGHEAQLALRVGAHVLHFGGAYGSRSGTWGVGRGLPFVWTVDAGRSAPPESVDDGDVSVRTAPAAAAGGGV